MLILDHVNQHSDCELAEYSGSENHASKTFKRRTFKRWTFKGAMQHIKQHDVYKYRQLQIGVDKWS